jgi:hypothetical protein
LGTAINISGIPMAFPSFLFDKVREQESIGITTLAKIEKLLNGEKEN